MTQKLYLIPSSLGNNDSALVPPYIHEILNGLDGMISEKARTTRRYLRAIGYKGDFDGLVFYEMERKIAKQDLKDIVDLFDQCIEIGLFSEAGSPAVADPGREVVKTAHKLGWEVVPIIGPNSLLLALMASGLNGQAFQFHGYLPKQRLEREKKIKFIEQLSLRSSASQLFIETPYRNNQLIESLLGTLRTNTKLCIASGLTTDNEVVKTMSVEDWRKRIPDVHKTPAVFIIGQ